MNEKESKLFDVRVVERNIANGVVTRAEYDAHLASLEDSEERSASVKSEFVVGVLDSEEDAANKSEA